MPGGNYGGEGRLLSPERHARDTIVNTSVEDIQELQVEVAQSLQVDVSSEAAIRATDRELIRIAEMRAETPDTSNEQEQTAFNDAAVESMLEVESGLGVEVTPIAALELDGYGGSLNEVVVRLHETHAVLPSGHEAAPILMAAIDELNGKIPDVLAGSGVELPAGMEKEDGPSSVEQVLELAKQTAAEKAKAGIERSEFNSPEVNEAIKSYFSDHEVALAVLGGMLGATVGDMADMRALEGTQLTLENSDMRDGIDRLMTLKEQGREDDFTELAKGMLRLIYCEPAAGQLTLDDAEVQRIAISKTEIAIELDRQLGRIPDPVRVLEEQVYLIEDSRISTRNEVRNAGQLLFHNTAYGQEVWRQGALRGRTQQGQMQDSIMTTTADMPGHSSSTHWSEIYDPHGYKQKTSRQHDSDVLEPQAVTYAVPIGEMIKKAPYARGLEYAVVNAKPEARVHTARVGENNSPVTGDIGPGSADMTGMGEPSMDRVFWASTDTHEAGAGYDVPIQGDEIMTLNVHTRNRESVVYQIQSESDMHIGLMGNKMEATAQDHRFIAEASARDVVYEYGKRIDKNSGTGYGYPQRRIIEDMNYSAELGTGQDAFSQSAFDVNKSAAEPVIREIEKESMDRFQGKYVVPLRAKESSFMFNADGKVDRRFGDSISFLMSKTAELKPLDN